MPLKTPAEPASAEPRKNVSTITRSTSMPIIAAVVGGIGNLPGSVLGGLVIGLAESFATGYISSTFQEAIVFAILIVVMLVRPSGLFGRAAVQKV